MGQLNETGQSTKDLISRQAAIDGLDGHRLGHRDLNEWQAGWNDALDWVQGIYLEDLPSAQPMMTNAADLINRGDAILAVNKRIKQLGMENDVDVLSIRQSIRDLASAQPYTEEEIQAMQDLEQAQLDKAYELGWEEGREALRREIWEDGRDRLD